MTRTKTRPTARPAKHPPNAFRKLTPSPAAVQDAVAKIQTIPQPAPLPTTAAETDAVLARVAPQPASPSALLRKLIRERMGTYVRSELRLMKADALSLARDLKHLGALFVESVAIIASNILDAALHGLWVLVFALTVYLGWTPCLRITEALAGKITELAGRWL